MSQPITRDLNALLDAVVVTRAELRFQVSRLRTRLHDSMAPAHFLTLIKEYESAEYALMRLHEHLRRRRALARHAANAPRLLARDLDDLIVPPAITVHGHAAAHVDDATPHDDHPHLTE